MRTPAKNADLHGNAPVIDVNDNFGRWRSDFNAQVEHCVQDRVRGKPVVELLRPIQSDYFELKPKRSGFYSRTLDILLRYPGVETVILTGLAANNCALVTANDAYMRDLHLAAPSDCVASNTRVECAVFDNSRGKGRAKCCVPFGTSWFR